MKNFTSFSHATKNAQIGDEIYALAGKLYPIARSITGDGVRESLDILAEHIPLQRREVDTGTPVFDWTVPNEWHIEDAYILTPAGEKIADFKSHNLHVLNYSAPVDKTLNLTELKQHIFTLPDQPDLIPYRTSYYAQNWGFCMSHNQLDALEEGEYRAVIKSRLEPGALSYGEYLHKGERAQEFLLSAHICHPSLANDNCSGLAVLSFLAKQLTKIKTRYSYRFIFAPGTIGSITWLAQNKDKVAHIKHGLVISCVGDGGGPTYKKTRDGNAVIDQAMSHVLRVAYEDPNILDFIPYGYDERQYGSPGFNLPVGLFQRSQFGTFPEYHTSGDNLDFIAPEHLSRSLELILQAIEIIENNAYLENLSPYCEPNLGKRGLYGAIGGKHAAKQSMAMLWVLNQSDGTHSLLEIAQKAGMEFSDILRAAELLNEHDLTRIISYADER